MRSDSEDAPWFSWEITLEKAFYWFLWFVLGIAVGVSCFGWPWNVLSIPGAALIAVPLMYLTPALQFLELLGWLFSW